MSPPTYFIVFRTGKQKNLIISVSVRCPLICGNILLKRNIFCTPQALRPSAFQIPNCYVCTAINIGK